jgi:hypothetical protein
VTPLESGPDAPCPNCGAAPTGRFCATCGQRNDRLRLTARALADDLTQAVLKVDRKVASTARALLTPGQLTMEYLLGRRARYAKPLSLYLLCAGLHYLAWSTYTAPLGKGHYQIGLASAEVRSEASDAGTGPDQRSALVQRLDRHPERAERVLEGFQSPKGQLTWVAALTLGLALATRKRRFLFSEHLIFTLHVQAFGSLLSALGLALGLNDQVGLALSVVYDAAAFVRVYGFGWWGNTWRFALANAVALLLLGLSLMVAVLGSLLW